jgi:hypothetical protein
MKKYLFAIPALLLFVSCIPGTKNEKTEAADFFTVPSENFSLRLPTYMSEAKNLNEVATLQYQNVIKNIFCIVIQESTAEVDTMLVQNELINEYPLGIEGYSKLIRDQFIENAGSDNVKGGTPLAKLEVNGADAMHFEADALVSGYNIHYHYGLIKGKTNYYQIITWTTVSKKDKFKDTMLEILKSFKEKSAQ